MNNIITSTLTQDNLNGLLDKYLKPYTPMFLCISGAHIYGFDSPDSDIDIRGAYLLNKEAIMGFWSSKNTTITSDSELIDGVEIDLVCHEISKYFKMVASGENGYVLEQIFSPIMLYQNDEFEKFKESVKKYYVTKKLYKHYSSFAFNKFEEFNNQDEKKIKTLLYTFRIMLTGINLFKTGNIITNIKLLNDEVFKYSFIEDLIALKQQENVVFNPNDDIDFYINEARKLLIALEEAYSESSLPENVRNKHKLMVYLPNLYYNLIFDQEFKISNMKYIDDKSFISKANEKLLLESSPFKSIEDELEYKIYPDYIVFMPDFDKYFSYKTTKQKGKNYHFIDIENYLNQIKSSNPFALLALYNKNKEKETPYITELLEKKDAIITKNINNSFKNVAKCLFNKIQQSDNYTYDSKQAIIMLAMLIQVKYIMQNNSFTSSYKDYMNIFKLIKNKECSKKEIINIYNELLEDLETKNNSLINLNDKVDNIFVNSILYKIKAKQWLNEA